VPFGDRGRELCTRGGFVFKAHRLLYHSTLGWIVIKKRKSSAHTRASVRNTQGSVSMCFQDGVLSAPLLSPPCAGVVFDPTLGASKTRRGNLEGGDGDGVTAVQGLHCIPGVCIKRLSVTSSVGTRLCPYSIAFRRAYDDSLAVYSRDPIDFTTQQRGGARCWNASYTPSLNLGLWATYNLSRSLESNLHPINILPHDGLRPFHQKSTCPTQLT